MPRLASVLLLTPFLLLTTANSIQPASAGSYYDNDGYYGGDRHREYRHSNCCYERIVKYKRVYSDEYRPHRHAYYGPYDGYRSPYYESPRYYSNFSYNFAGPCRRRVIVHDYQGEPRGGWVSGC
jgi:hypothetical protein